MSWNPNDYQFAWNVVWEYREWLLQGTLLTLKIAAVSMGLSMFFALPLALARMSRFVPLSAAAQFYIAVLRAIEKGRREAALSTGLSASRAFAKVIWPQAWRIIIPPLASNFIGIIKDSSLVGIIGLNELMRQAQIATSLSFRPFELYTAAMVIYVVLALIISPLASVVERRAARS